MENPPTASLARTVSRIQDILRKDPGIDGDAQRLAQLAWMLFFRVYDTMKGKHLPAHLRWRGWELQGPNSSSHATAIQRLNESILPELRRLDATQKEHRLLAAAMRDAQNAVSSDALLSEMAGKIETGIPLNSDLERSVFADVYEQLLANLQSAGNAGEYYTPLPLARMIVSLLDPKPGDKVLDFACGTGGFLTSAINHIRAKESGSSSSRKDWIKLVKGVEKKPLPHLLCVTNMLLHGVDEPTSIVRGNMLERPLDSYTSDDQVDLIVSNPPFGGLEEDHSFENFSPIYKSRDTADLFILLAIRLLRPGGRAGIIIPDGFLFASGVRARIRKALLEECDVHTIVRLPRGVFSPYTTISTNVLFFTKGQKTKKIDYYQHTAPGGATYSKTNPVNANSLERVGKWYATKRKVRESWRVEFAEVAKSGYNLDQRKAMEELYSPEDLKNSILSIEKLESSTKAMAGLLMGKLLSRLPRDLQDIFSSVANVISSSPKALVELEQAIYEFGISGLLIPNAAKLPGDRGNNGKANEQMPLGLSSNEITGKANPLVSRRPIPMHWRLRRLSEVCEIVGGSTPSSGNPEFFTTDGGVPWLTPADLNDYTDKYIRSGKRNLTQLGLDSCSARLLPKGSVLFSSRAPIGYVAIAANDIATNQGFKSLVPSRDVNSEFLYYFLCAERRTLEAHASGTVFKEIPGRAMKEVVIPLPPLDQQVAIVGEIDKLIGELRIIQKSARRLEDERAALPEIFACATASIASLPRN